MPSGVFDHWLIWDLAPTSKGFAEGEGKGGVNGMGQAGFMGPCPPDREHRYFFKLYALDAPLKLKPRATKEHVMEALKPHLLGESQLMGTFGR